jgi:hypothetical protein
MVRVVMQSEEAGAMDFSAFIWDKGVEPLALVFGVPRSTIYSWARRNNIPRKRWDRLMEAYPKLRYRHLVEMEGASREKAA